MESQKGSGFRMSELAFRLAETTGPKTQNKAIERIQVRCSSPRAVTNDRLVLQHKDSATTARTPPGAQFGNSGQQVDGEYE